MKINEERFFMLMDYAHQHPKGIFKLYDAKGQFIESYFDTDCESDNGLEVEDEGYEEYPILVFRKVADSTLFEVNYHQIPVRAECDGKVIYSMYGNAKNTDL